MKRCLCGSLLAILVWLGATLSVSAAGPSTASWAVHRVVDIADIPRGPNRLVDPGFEAGATSWTTYGTRYVIDAAVAHSGSRSVRLPSGALGAAIQRVALNQSAARPIYFGGWSKASAATGGCRMQYSLYLDITYTDGTQGESQWVCLAGGTHDWQYVEKIIWPPKPIATVWLWTMFQSASPGTAWFDDLALGEFAADIATFDGARVLRSAPSERPWEGAPTLRVATSDGLSLGLAAYGGLPVSLQVNGSEELEAANLYAGGFYVRDVAAGGDFVHLGGTVTSSGSDLVFQGSDATLGLSLTATFRPQASHILIDASLQDLRGTERAITLYFALPLAPGGRTWQQDIHTSAPAASLPEHRYIAQTTWGANGAMSHYCMADLTSSQSGLSLAYPMDHPVVARFVYNSQTHQYYVAADLGLSPQARNPGRADVRLLLYAHEPRWGFRAAFAKYMSIYPQFFTARVSEGGSWVLHQGLDNIPNISDFGIKFHSTGDASVYARDDANGVRTLRYLCEPWGKWLSIPASVDHTNYSAVMGYVRTMLSSPISSERNWGNAILSSAVYDAQGRARYEAADEPFASHAAAFVLNADPDISLPGYYPNRGQMGWAESTKEAYRHPEWGILDGELIDSFEHNGELSNFRAEHFPFSDLPLTFDMTSKRVVLPEVFSSYEFSKKVSDEVHALGKWTMANSALLRWVFEAPLFDVMGSERGWLAGSAFCPEGDALLSQWRTFAYHKPYCVVQNTDLTVFDHAMVDKYFAVCAFYGIYPGFFTYNSGVTNYWARPDWYERDRDLFRKYMPVITALNQAGWEPIPNATTNRSTVYLERYGRGNRFYVTLRNMATSAQTTTVTVDLAALGLPAVDGYTVTELLGSSPIARTREGSTLTLTVPMPPESTRILHIELPGTQPYTIYLQLGWNLVSYSLDRVQDLSVAAAPLGSRLLMVNSFDSADPDQLWRTFEPGSPVNSLLLLRPGHDYWVKVTQACQWTLR